MVVTGFMAFALWDGPDLRSMLIFMSLAFVMQVFLRVRYRESVKCPHCGFDPILYGQDHERAATKVKVFLEQRKDNPQYMLRAQPRIKPLVRKAEAGLKSPSQVLPQASPLETHHLEGPTL